MYLLFTVSIQLSVPLQIETWRLKTQGVTSDRIVFAKRAFTHSRHLTPALSGSQCGHTDYKEQSTGRKLMQAYENNEARQG